MTNKGINITLWKMQFQPAFNPRHILYDDMLAESIGQYSHVIANNIGFQNASFSMSLSYAAAIRYYNDVLGFFFDVYDHNIDQVFEGIINKVTIQSGGLTAVNGPLFDSTNRTAFAFTPLYIVSPAMIRGDQQFTTIVENTDAQLKYGIIERIISAGEALVDLAAGYNEAEQARDTFITENAYPARDSLSFAIDSGTAVTLTFEVIGFQKYLEYYIYNDATIGTVTISSNPATSKLQMVINADPNGIFVIDNTKIESNVTIVSQQEDQDRTAMAIINGMLTLGDGSFNRYIFGVYEDRTIIYRAVPDYIMYQARVFNDANIIEKFADDSLVMPWNVRPGNWIVFSDFFISDKIQSTPQRNDPRYMFIETVSYSIPFGLQINGARISEISQMLAQMGLRGLTV